MEGELSVKHLTKKIMKYPKFLPVNGTVGVACPSFGCPYDPYLGRLNNGINNLIKKGYKIIKSDSIYCLNKAESNNKINRANELMKLYTDPNVDFIIAVTGGEIMMDILPFLDKELLKSTEPKFYLGYSDNTIFTFYLTTAFDIASIYGPNLTDFGMEPWHEAINDTMDIITGNVKQQTSYLKYEMSNLKEDNILAPYNCTEPVYWKNLNGDQLEFEGRIIGGCLDVLLLFLGTPYDHVNEFNEKYKDDGVVWYLEACDLHSIAVRRALWQLKENGWFKYVRGFMFGRPKNEDTPFDISHEDAIKEYLLEYNVPIIMNVDIGHVKPSITIINGSYVNIFSKDGMGKIVMNLKK